MPKWILSVILGFVGLTFILTLMLAAVPSLATAMEQYITWCQQTGNSCIRDRNPGDQPGLC